MKVRSRYAPSPTGFTHVGGVRTALFAWALAAKYKGEFILRIEDTDQSRQVAGAVDHVIESLKWLGVDWQEGPDIGGDFGPYTQSERLEIYRKWAQKLVDSGHAYADPYTPEQVNEFRQAAQAEKRAFLFREHRPNELSVPDDWHKKVSLRFKTPELKRYEWHDEVRGNLSAGEEALDDFVIMKSDGFPTYNFAHVIDDYLMEITHIFRGEEFIASVPKFLSLYDALGIDPPKLVTVPPILNQNGGKKLSKRDGAKDVLEYKDDGVLPEALMNFLASLGWNDGTEQEVFTPEEFVSSFSIDRIQKSGAKFDETRLQWLNWQHIERLVEAGEVDRVLGLANITDDVTQTILSLAMSKANSVETLKQQVEIFTKRPSFKVTDESSRLIDKKLTAEMATSYLKAAVAALESTDFSESALESSLRATMDELEAKPRHFLNLIRWAVSNSKVSPSLFEMLAVLGHDETLERLRAALD